MKFKILIGSWVANLFLRNKTRFVLQRLRNSGNVSPMCLVTSDLIVSSIVSVIALVTTLWCHEAGPAPWWRHTDRPPPAEDLSHADTSPDTGAWPEYMSHCHTCVTKLILCNLVILQETPLGIVFKTLDPFFLHLIHLQPPRPTPRCNDNGTKAFQKPSPVSLVALRLLSSVQADSSSGYLSIIVLIPGEWWMAGNGCILSWPGDGGRHNTTSGAICSPQCYTRAEITAEQNRGIPSLCPASGPLMWSPLSLSRGQLYSPWCGDHPSIVTSWHSARGDQHYPIMGEGRSKHGRLKTEVWTNTTHNCLLWVRLCWWRGHRHKRGIC